MPTKGTRCHPPRKLLPTQIPEGTVPGLRYRLEGELVPVLHMALDGSLPVYFEHHVLLWKYPNMQIGLHPCARASCAACSPACRCCSCAAESAGELAFSRDAPGHIVALHLPAGEGIVVREHQFLAATENVQYDYSRIKGFANMMFGGGFFVDQFFAGQGEGVVWVHGYGNVFEKVLEPGESIDIEPGGWLYHDHSVSMSQEAYGFKTGFLVGVRPARLQPLHRSGPSRPAERLLPPARSGDRRRRWPGCRRVSAGPRRRRDARRDHRRPAGQLR